MLSMIKKGGSGGSGGSELEIAVPFTNVIVSTSDKVYNGYSVGGWNTTSMDAIVPSDNCYLMLYTTQATPGSFSFGTNIGVSCSNANVTEIGSIVGGNNVSALFLCEGLNGQTITINFPSSYRAALAFFNA